MSFLEREKDGYVLSLTMNSPDTRNALTGDEQFEDFVAVCKEINDDKHNFWWGRSSSRKI